MTQVTRKIDLAKFGGPTFIGRPNGEAARQKLSLDEIDANEDMVIEVDIPETTYSINSSFFLGLFGKSIRKAGSEEKFLNKYKFRTHGKEYLAIKRGIQRALVRNKNLIDGS